MKNKYKIKKSMKKVYDSIKDAKRRINKLRKYYESQKERILSVGSMYMYIKKTTPE